MPSRKLAFISFGSCRDNFIPERLFLCFRVSGYYWALRYGGGGCHGDARKDGCNAFIGFRQREN